MSDHYLNSANSQPTTGDRILALIEAHPEGIDIRELCLTLNRSVSMVQRYLKILIAQGKVYSKLSENGMHLIYYPTST